MKKNNNPITEILYYINEDRKEYYEMEIFYFKLKKYKVPLRVQINFAESKYYKCDVDYKLWTKDMESIANFKKIELYELEFDEKYKKLFQHILDLNEFRIMYWNKTARKLFYYLTGELEKIIKGVEYV